MLPLLRRAARHPLPWSAFWRLASFAAFLFSLPVCFSFLHYLATSPLDYPIQIISTFRILHGEAPFRDFQTLYGPLGYYIAAVVVWPFRARTPVTVLNGYVVACLVLFYAVLCASLARLRLPRPIFLIGSAALVVASSKALVNPAWYSLPMLLPLVLATVTMQYTVPSASRTPARALFWQSATGLLLAAEVFIRFNFALYAATAILVVAIAAFFFGDRRVSSAAARCLALSLVFLLVLSAGFAAAGILFPFLSDLRTYLPRAVVGRGVSWKYVDHTLAFATAASLLATLLRALPRILHRRIDLSLVPYINLIGLFAYTFLRFDGVHVLPFLMFSLLLLADPWEDPAPVPPQVRRIAWFGLPELQLLALLVLFHIYQPMRSISRLESSLHMARARPAPGPLSLPEPVTELHQVVLYTEEARMLARLDKLRAPADEVFWMSAPDACRSTFDMCMDVGLYLADRTWPRQAIWYFDTATTPYPDIQQRIVNGLEASRTPWIGVQDVFVPNPIGGPATSSTLLNDYVLSHYSLVFSTDIPNRNRRYRIYTRRSPH